MPYRSAILSAIEDLKDHQTGSPAASIRRRINEHDTVFSAAITNSDDDTTWNETLFQTTLKSLVTKGVLSHVNGTNYKFSDDHLKRRAEELRARAESMEERQHAMAATHRLNPREEPPKELPKKKTVHAKVKMNEGKIITVVNAEGGKKQHDGDDMETGDEEVNEVLMDGKNDHKKHVKIIPRKVGAKKMYVAAICDIRSNEIMSDKSFQRRRQRRFGGLKR
ncbi:hypothetical protein ACHAXR_005232 [Thalassiosira sp. AJA248-18]